MGDLEWTNELVIRLMQEYRKRPELWDPSHEMYRVQTLKYETWRKLAAMFECDIADLRKKLNSLFASHRREKSKVRGGHKSSWFLYDHMSFLPSHIDCDTSYVKVQATEKVKAPVREAPPPSVSDDDDDERDPDYEVDEEFLEDDEPEPEPQTEVLIKEEPTPPAAVQKRSSYSRRMKRDRVHAKPRLTRPMKRRVFKETHIVPRVSHSSTLDDSLTETLNLLRRSDLTRRKDECDSFGEYIADSLRKHDDRTQSMIKQAINNILFEQEMKKYSNLNQQYVVISGIDENPLILSDETEK